MFFKKNNLIKVTLAPSRVLVLIQVGVASLKEQIPDKLSGTIHRKNKTKTAIENVKDFAIGNIPLA